MCICAIIRYSEVDAHVKNTGNYQKNLDSHLGDRLMLKANGGRKRLLSVVEFYPKRIRQFLWLS